MTKLIDLKEWQALLQHHHEIKDMHMRDWFANDDERYSRFNLQSGEILLDYSRNRITDHTIELLCNLALAVKLPEKIESLFSGQPVNMTEHRPALHTALRAPHDSTVHVEGQNIIASIADAQRKMQDFVTAIHSEKWLGATGKPIRHIINIGIGGSHLGPMMCTHALKDFAVSPLEMHYVSSVDPHQLNEVLQKINPETSLFIISSKSFTTLETLTNARALLSLIKDKFGDEAISKHFIAVTASAQNAIAFGIPEQNIFPVWDWIGGRYSIWSAIGLPLMLMIGNKQFADFLEGAYEMDQHFRHSKFSQNIPVLMALLSIWNTNFLGANAQAVVPYSHQLRYFIPYLQQAEMESNGKRTDLHGNGIEYITGPILFGQEGCDGQHAYHQSLHQGQHLIPVDFIMIGNGGSAANRQHQDILIASGLSQAQALMRGKTLDEAYNELIATHHTQQVATELAPHKAIPGNKPSNILLLHQITPRNLGALIALYEHKIFTQSIIWNINAFDQWGVELGKQLLPAILQQVQQENNETSVDSATAGLIHHLKKTRGES